MTVLQPKQIASLTNIAVKNALGIADSAETLIQEDLTGVVDAGTKIASQDDGYVNFLYNLGIAVSARIFVDRSYTSKAPNIFKTTFEYGQIIQKTRASLEEATDNQAYELVNGASYDENIFYGGIVDTKVFTKRVTWQIAKSIPEDQIKNAFNGPQEMGNFVSMIFTMIQNSIQVKMDELVMATINNMTAETIHSNNSRIAVNVLAEYKKIKPDTTLKASNCYLDVDFLKFFAQLMNKRTGLIERYSKLFNLNGAKVFTPKDKQHVVVLDEIASAFSVYLESSTFHNELVKLPYYETVSYWQGLGNTGDFGDTSKIKVKTSLGNDVEQSGILAVVFDDDACGINHIDEKVRSKYNNTGEFINYWYKKNMSYFNDFDENFIVFYVAD